MGSYEPSTIAQGLAALAPRLSEPLLREALAIAMGSYEPSTIAQGLAALAPRLSEPLLREALAIARNTPDDWFYFTPPVYRFNKDPASKSRFTSARRVTKRHQVLAALAPRLSEPLLREALAIARSIHDNQARAAALAALAPYLSGSLSRHAFMMVKEIYISYDSLYPILSRSDQCSDAAIAMLGLAPRLPASQQTEALTLAERFHFNDGLLLAAIDLARQLPKSPQAEVFQEKLYNGAIETARRLNTGRESFSNWYRQEQINSLIDVLPYLPEQRRTGVASEILKLIDVFGYSVIRERIIALAPYISKQLLPAAEKVFKDGILPSCLPEALLPEALAIGKKQRNIEWLLALAPRLREPLLTEAFTAAKEIGGATSQVELMAQSANAFGRISRTNLYPAWCDTLHGMANLSRQVFLDNLRSLPPIIVTLGGQEAIDGIFCAIRDVELRLSN
jgi:hypothetical protein